MKELAHVLYDAYNAGGSPETANRNFRGDPCPTWADLPENVKNKWRAVEDELTSRLEATGDLDHTGCWFVCLECKAYHEHGKYVVCPNTGVS